MLTLSPHAAEINVGTDFRLLVTDAQDRTGGPLSVAELHFELRFFGSAIADRMAAGEAIDPS